ncbi:hypothetical protein EET67_06100 [Pseudaminobacter arsenicus]|uniref:DUF945 domain-containing protein n=1 Tax=Borborobacter arsenicus TaxID=1851146 RepID=A0A432V928_9HYPH|nr:hypothetical protein [Pseudaminobacter arsenicus]RUM98674.1 hypothetical protein EET67_06100 [Pseudaminobacter arsenicus]
MTICRSTLVKLAFSTALLTLPLQTALAQDANAVAERFRTLMTKQGVEVSWTGVSGDADEMVIEGAAFGVPGEEDRFQVGKLTFEDVSEKDGGYRIGTISTEPYHFNQDKLAIDVSAMTFNGVLLPAAEDTDPVKSLLMYETTELASVEVKLDDKPLFSLTNLSGEITPPSDGKPMEFTGAVEKFTADLTVVEDPASKAVIEGLGYQTISGNIEMAGSWQPTDGRMALTQNDITIDDAGTLGFSFDIGGYTPSFMQSLQDLQKKMADQPAGADDSAQGLAMLGLMQQLTFHGANIRFDDDSLTGRVLEYFAEQQGMKPEDIANQAKAIVPFLTAQLNNPELSGQITAALNTFLDDPESLEITAAPASPVPFALIAAGGMAAPLELPKTLGVSVTANAD